MSTYPINYEDFKNRFNTEKKCIDYLYNLRWNNSFSCPRCECHDMWQINERKYKCKDCGYQATITSGTYFQGTHLPLTVWFEAIWHIVSQREEANGIELQEYLKLGNNRTALNLLYKIRTIMRECDSDKLRGVVYIDDIRYHTKRDSLYSNAFLAAEIKEDAISRIRISAKFGFENFVKNHIEVGSEIHIKHTLQYGNVPDGYSRIVEPRSFSHNRLPRLYDLFKDLRRKNLTAHTPRNSSYENKDLCVSECCYKYNRLDKDVGLLFNEILYYAVHIKS